MVETALREDVAKLARKIGSELQAERLDAAASHLSSAFSLMLPDGTEISDWQRLGAGIEALSARRRALPPLVDLQIFPDGEPLRLSESCALATGRFVQTFEGPRGTYVFDQPWSAFLSYVKGALRLSSLQVGPPSQSSRFYPRRTHGDRVG